MLSNYINVDGKARVSLINGPLVVYDEVERHKAVILIKGLVKKRSMLSTAWVANTNPKPGSDILQGVIYKVKAGAAGRVPPKGFVAKKGAAVGKEMFENISQL